MAKKIVIFGGTFDPIHYGHIKPVSQACIEVAADELIFIPCHIPPHKQTPAVTSQDRLNMVQLVADELNQALPFIVSCSAYELEQEGKSYTRLTIEHFAKLYPECELYFVIGMDSYVNFTKWFKWHEILDYCQLMVLSRPGYQPDQSLQPGLLVQKSQFVNVEQVDISSTELRQNREEKDMDEWVTLAVKSYIAKHNLYN